MDSMGRIRVVYNRLAGWMASLIVCVSSQMETVGASKSWS